MVGDDHPPHQRRAAFRRVVAVQGQPGVVALLLRRPSVEVGLAGGAQVGRAVVLAEAATESSRPARSAAMLP